MRDLQHPLLDDVCLSAVFNALSDPIRLSVVQRLSVDGELCCNELEMPVSKSSMSHHFRVLREAGLTRTRIVGTRHYLTLRHDEVGRRFPGLLDTVLSLVGEPVPA
ncbi:metalloregulator ArsR/SmtB family transcription factor [Micromonospora sp. NBC_01699]|uniref:ArsR/SmtB family transcription factor n=1 Tax=Micromonospora sp. NBC_01699 TaxID=2975984 RepID=UPI002E31D1CE|nr:metalloregulator ArsR/SmtB family transcription factor [Micromonospora sp. NBC_01699]